MNTFLDTIRDVATSPYLWAALAAYFIGQLTKVSIFAASGKRVTLRDFFSSGNMPSTHAASTVALTVVVGMHEGFGSAVFAVAAMLTMVICYDAMHVRRAVGEQGMVQMYLLEKLSAKDRTAITSMLQKKTGRNTKFAYFSRGHLPEEVIAGAILGLLVGGAIGFISLQIIDIVALVLMGDRLPAEFAYIIIFAIINEVIDCGTVAQLVRAWDS